MIEKNYYIVYFYAQTSHRHVHKILQWIGSSDFKFVSHSDVV